MYQLTIIYFLSFIPFERATTRFSRLFDDLFNFFYHFLPFSAVLVFFQIISTLSTTRVYPSTLFGASSSSAGVNIPAFVCEIRCFPLSTFPLFQRQMLTHVLLPPTYVLARFNKIAIQNNGLNGTWTRKPLAYREYNNVSPVCDPP